MTLSAASLISFGALVCYTALLLIVLRRDIRSRVHQFFALYLLSMIIWSFAAFMIFVEIDAERTLFWNRFMVVGSAAMPIVFLGFVQEYVGKPHKRWMQLGLLVYIGTQIANVMGLVIKDAYVDDGRLYNTYGPLVFLPSVIWAVFIGYSAFILIREYRASRDARYRNKLKYPLIVIILIGAASLTNTTVLRIYPMDVAVNVLCALLIAYAIFRYQLLDISVVARTGLVYSILTVIIGASYFLFISLVTRVFHALAGPQIFALSLIVAVVTAVVAQPLRVRAQTWIDRLFFRDKYDSRRMLGNLSRTAALVLDLNTLTDTILSEVCNTMHIEGAAFFLRQDNNGDFALMAQRGLETDTIFRLSRDHPIVDWLSRHDTILTDDDVSMMPQFRALWDKEQRELEEMGAELYIPLKAQDELAGVFAVGPKRSQVTFSQDDQLTLMTLANQTATAIEKARLYEASQQELLQRKRAEAELRRRAAHLEALNATIAAAAAAVGLQELLEIALEHSLRALDLEMGAIWLARDWEQRGIEEDGSAVDPAAPDSLVVQKGIPPDSGPVLAHIARTSVTQLPGPIVEEGIQQTSVGILAVQHGIRASLTVPIMAEGQRIGGLSLLAPEPRRWSDDDVAMVEAIGRQLGTAAERLRLFHEVQRHADELADALAQAQELDRLKSEFVQSVSHELRTPLALARGYAELLGAGELGGLSSQQQNAADIIVRRVRMLSELVEDITLILVAEARPLTREPVPLDELARAAVEDFRVTTEKNGIQLYSKIAENVAPAVGEAVYLRRVLDNLLQNAVKFTPEGNSITVLVWQASEDVFLQVSDTGIGIPKDKLESIFDRFFQVDGSSRRRYGGVGLGLALVKQVVETLGGDVSVESAVDKGSTFTVRLPVAE